MKKILFTSLLIGAALLPQLSLAQSTVKEGQSTEGKDFWVTFLQADQASSDGGPYDGYNEMILSLSLSARNACEVIIENPFTGYSETVQVEAGSLKEVILYNEGNARTTTARNKMAQTGKVCYAVNSEQVDTCALHVTSTENISLFAANYKKATFDATNVIPTQSLLSEYYIQTYTPSNHKGSTQGSHFCIIATEDHTVVDFCPTVQTQGMSYGYYSPNFPKVGDTLTTPELMKGQVFYVWTGNVDDVSGDLSGTWVKARDNKKIAVFQGCPHTNIPYQTKERDHIVSQAMPTQYWGNTFAVTASNGRHRDIYRIMALNDETEVYVKGIAANGGDSLVYKFDFATNPKHYWEFEIGDRGTKPKSGRWKDQVLPDPLIVGTNGIIETSCPCALHLFLTSKNYDGVNDGDPAMLWVNPIEQQIDQVTFTTYSSKNGTTAHNVNIVTANPEGMTLNGASISGEFSKIQGGDIYYFARKSLGSAAGAYTLKNEQGSFIAHVYGFTENESYGYSAGGATKPLTQYITINGKIFTPDSDNSLCGDDTVKFACHPDYEYEKIVWGFGDGQIDDTNKDSIPHLYEKAGVYQAYCNIYRKSSNLCKGQNAMDSIPIRVTIGNFKVTVDSVYVTPCRQEGKRMIVEIFLDNPAQVDLSSNNDSVKLGWNAQAGAHGFTPGMIHVIDKNKIEADIPESAQPATDYAITLHIGSECPSGVTNTELPFTLNYENVMARRFQNVIGLQKASFENFILSDFQWYKDSVLMPSETNSVLNLGDQTDFVGEYYICFTMVNTTTGTKSTSCSCPVKFDESEPKDMQFESTYINLQQAFQRAGEQIYVNTKGNSTVEWYTIKGDVLQTLSLPEHGGLVTVPEEPGMYILRVTTDKEKRTFKFVVFSK
ncbi:MAG: T9SS type A sorting domain-containing protein [Paludibacteraceae bacterium]|nr:T9SS type A sorting domain-containing protein [Paludibacteraceae bacterium]